MLFYASVASRNVCFLECTDFESAIRLAVSIGGDSDTIAAITGSIAEAYYGIPQHIQAKASGYLPKEMQDVIIKFKRRMDKKQTLSMMLQCTYFWVRYSCLYKK